MAAPKSTKTTVGGWIAFLSLAFMGLAAIFDGNPETHPDGNAIAEAGQAVGAFGAAVGAAIIGIFGRDNNVSSENQPLQ